MSLELLALIADEFETQAGVTTPANDIDDGYWKRIAVASEAIAGTSSSANDFLLGYMRRAMVALEGFAGTSGESTGRDAYVRRMAVALETLNSSAGVGSWDWRLYLAISAFTGGSTIPNNIEPPVISGLASVGASLSCSTGTWTHSPLSYTYQWLADGATIVGETASEYAVDALDEGAMISCLVTAHNASGDSSPEESNEIGPIVGEPDAPSGMNFSNPLNSMYLALLAD